MSFSQFVQSDFSGGFNDTSSAISVKDNELVLSENADYSAEYKALQTRMGCEAVNELSFEGEATDGHGWIVGSTYKKCVIVGGVLYDLAADGTKTSRITLTEGATHIYPFEMYNKLYFGDGTELYVWGDSDYNSEQGTITIATGDIVKNNNAGTLKGKFFKALSDLGSIDLTTEDFSVVTDWADVTDVRHFSSNVVRTLTAHDPSCPEVVLISVLNAATAAATISVTLDNVTFTFSVASGASVPTIVTAMNAMTTAGWTKAIDGNAVRFTKTASGLSANGYVDPSTSGVSFTYTTEQEGAINDCNLADIKKCTIFAVHSGSFRVFAAGNPDDNALYYSEIGLANYFKGEINKLYPSGGGFGKITAMANLSDALLVSYESGWYSWTGITPLTDAYWKPLNIPYGCACPKSVALTPSSFTFLGKDGLYNVSASILSYEAVLLQGKEIIKKITSNTVEKTLRSISDKVKCRAVFYNNVYYLAYNTDGSNNTRVLKYEWDSGSFTIVTGWKVNAWIADPANLYFATTNYVLKTNTGYHDVDVTTGADKAIAFHVKTKEYTFGAPLMNKVVQMVGFIFKQGASDVATAAINVITGYETYSFQAANLAESLIWNRIWGATWGWREAIVKMAELIKVSNTFQIEIINNNLDEPITLIGIGFVYEKTDLVTPNMLKDEVLNR